MSFRNAAAKAGSGIALALALMPAAAFAQDAQPAAPPAPPEVSKSSASLPAGHYRLDPAHSFVLATVRHLHVSNYVVRFDKMEGDFTFDPAHVDAFKLQASVDVTSLDVGADYSGKFADEFLNAKTFSQATFVATSLTPNADGRSGTLAGNLTMMGVTKPVTFDVTLVGVGHGLPLGGAIAGFSATTTIRRSDFGSRYVLAFVADEVRIDIQAEFARK
jgi:polyisoprenoid-binding protein YceI